MVVPKKTNISILDVNVPEMYMPEWHRKGLTPYKVDQSRFDGIDNLEDFLPRKKVMDVKKTKDKNERIQEGAKLLGKLIDSGKVKEKDLPGMIKEGLDGDVVRYWKEMNSKNDEVDLIKPAAIMEPSSTSMWFEADNPVDEINKIVDNNVIVDSLSTIQRDGSALDAVRQKLTKVVKEDVVDVGGYILTLFGKIVCIGAADKVKKTATNIIMEGKHLEDDDLLLFRRIPITDMFE